MFGISKRVRINKILMLLFIIVTISFVVYRITIHADIYDEIINLSVSYRIAMGDIPFYHCWEAFQSGDVFMAPFIWIYMKIFRTTSGLILYSRIIYLLALLVVAFTCYQILKKHLINELAFLLSYIVLFFELYSLFYLWYDTVSIVFLLLGDNFLLYALESENKLNRSLAYCLAGFLHCCMVFAYPSFMFLAILIAIILFFLNIRWCEETISHSLFVVLLYAMGAFLFVFFFLLFLSLSVGLFNVYETLCIILSTRSANSLSILGIFRDIIVAYISTNQLLIPITVILMVLYFSALKKGKYTPFFLIGMIVLPVFNQVFIEKGPLMGLANYLSYIMLWCPFLYYLINHKNCFDRYFFNIFFLPSILSGILISLTTVYADIGPVKAWQACLPGALASLYYMIKIFSNIEFKCSNVSKLLLCIVIIELLVNSYSYIYLNQPYIRYDNVRVKDGLYWGIKINNGMESWLKIESLVKSYGKECDTVLAGGRLRPIYMISGLKPCVWSVEAPSYELEGNMQWDKAIEYFEYFGEYPDIIFVEPYEIINNDIGEILEDKYTLITSSIIGEFNIVVYKKTLLIEEGL